MQRRARLQIASALAVLALLAACGPVARFPGGRLRGELVTEPVSDWSFSDAFQTIAVETRPVFPHSVTTLCFTHEGELYVPAAGASRKKWTHYVLDDPNVRVKIGDKVYLAKVTVLHDAFPPALRESARKKYPRIGSGEVPDLWVFRVESRG